MKPGQKIYIGILSLIIVLVFFGLLWFGYPYYRLPLDERFFSPEYMLLKPGGLLGHGYGIIGSLSILIGVSMYMARKRMKMLSRAGILKYWLEFHIFLCTLGPVLILYHTSFKFGGLVAVSFWSMVAVFLSGIIGRFIYIQIPRSIEGRELSLSEVREMKTNIGTVISGAITLDEESYNIIIESTKKKVGLYDENLIRRIIKTYLDDRKTFHRVRSTLRRNNIKGKESRNILKLVRHEMSLNRKIDRLQTMQKLFRYWHVAHFPFAIVMLIIMLIHVGVSITFGYHWIF
jgi:hypothetical protein